MNMRTNIEMQPCVELHRDEVARRTLQLWEAAGRPTGRDLEYWLQAEVELLSERQHCRPIGHVSRWPAVSGKRHLSAVDPGLRNRA
jgi:hypothetical protein